MQMYTAVLHAVSSDVTDRPSAEIALERAKKVLAPITHAVLYPITHSTYLISTLHMSPTHVGVSNTRQ